MRRLLSTAGLFLAALLMTFVGSLDQASARYSAIVVDAETGMVLYAYKADVRRYPASLTKIMTLYMTFQALEDNRLSLDQKLPVSRRAAGQTPIRLGLKYRQTLRVEDAILAVITKSANDAATVLAEALGGTEAKFARDMTDKARELGMKRTTFRNATGLPNRRQRSTARDMATLSLALIRDFPDYYSYFSRLRFKYGSETIHNHNNLLEDYPGADGIKTGYIRASGFNLVASAQRGDTRLVGVVFGGRSPEWRDERMMALLDRGFARRNARVAAVSQGPQLPTVNKSPAQVTALPENASNIAVPIPLPDKPDLPPKPVVVGTYRPATQATGEWGVQVGTFRRLPSAERRVHQVAQLAPTFLMHKGVSIVPVQQSEQTLYRARLTGLDRQDARRACRVLRKRHLRCVVLSPNSLNTADS